MLVARILAAEVNTVSESATTEWQSKILRELAEFLTLPEKAPEEWNVRRPTASAYKAAVDLITEMRAADLSASNGRAGSRWGHPV